MIIAVYVDDLNIISTINKFKDACGYLKRQYEIKDLGKTKFCISQ